MQAWTYASRPAHVLLLFLLQERCLELLPRLNAWLEGWSCSLAGAGLSPEQLLTFSNAKSEFWLYLVEMLSKLTEHPDLQVRLVSLIRFAEHMLGLNSSACC